MSLGYKATVQLRKEQPFEATTKLQAVEAFPISDV